VLFHQRVLEVDLDAARVESYSDALVKVLRRYRVEGARDLDVVIRVYLRRRPARHVEGLLRGFQQVRALLCFEDLSRHSSRRAVDPGSIAVLERFWRTMKQAGTRPILVPYSAELFQKELDVFVRWYNELRPHSTLGGRTPQEVYMGIEHPAALTRIEPRARYPISDVEGASGAVVRVRHVELATLRFEGRRHLPAPVLRIAA
jgi:hypothetical protein